MSRIIPVKFLMSYKIRFSINIRGHHVYKSVWKPEEDKKLDCYKDEGSMYDSYAIGVYKKEKDSTLVGYVPMECLTLVDDFLKAGKENRLTAVVSGKRKRKDGR